jgi:Fur family transcriptional regulator, ferric uptake regulator
MCQIIAKYIKYNCPVVDRFRFHGLLLQLGAIRMSCFTTLKKKGLRLTKPRRVILEYIHDKGDHLTAEEIISHVHNQFPHINKSTIYRTLELLEKNECVFKSESMDRTIYHHVEAGHHHHLVCSKCGKTIDCDEDIFSPVEKTLEKNLGFQVNFKHLVMIGLCKECRSKNS